MREEGGTQGGTPHAKTHQGGGHHEALREATTSKEGNTRRDHTKRSHIEEGSLRGNAAWDVHMGLQGGVLKLWAQS